MRIKIHLKGSGILPFDHHYYLSSALYKYKEIANKDLAARLHYSKEIKTYTFSEILVPKRKIHSNGIEILNEYAYFVYSSPVKEYVEALVQGLINEPELIIGDLKFTVMKIEVLPISNINWNDVILKTISPITMYSTSNARKKDLPLFPTQNTWYVNLEKNIKHQYEVVYGKKPEGKIRVETIEFRPKRYMFRKVSDGKVEEGPIIAVQGHFRFYGSPELIKFTYEAGVGERGAMGFGCLEIARKVDQNIYIPNK